MLVVALVVVSGCASGVSNCKGNVRDNLRSTKRGLGSYDLIGTVIDIAALPVTTVATCAKDVAVSPAYEVARSIRQRAIKAERVAADDPRVSKNAVKISTLKIEQVAAIKPPSTVDEKKCEYRANCVAASTLLVTPARTAGKTVLITNEHQQYELTNRCGEQIECFICGTKDNKVSKPPGTICADAAARPLENGETWIGDGSAENVDGMALSCLPFDGNGYASCKTWPD